MNFVLERIENMSKFSKALEKLQKAREEKEGLNEKRGPHFEIPEGADQNTASWDRGIPVARNAKPDTRIVTYHYPTSLLTEQYRMLSHNLKTQLDKEDAKVILISSAIHGEGKTITATNLALALTEMGNSKVVLIDADLRRGKVGEYLGLTKNLPGLSSYLSNGLSIKQAMVRNSIDNLTIIPAGELTSNPSGLLGSEKFRALVRELRNHFDYVLIDSPPIMSVADAGILGRDVDGLLMIIQTGRTPKTVIAHANILFRQAGVKLLGYVLTNVEFQSADYRYYYHHHYYDQYTDQEQDRSFSARLTNVKDRALHELRKLGPFLEKGEQRFNQWWEKKILKKGVAPQSIKEDEVINEPDEESES